MLILVIGIVIFLAVHLVRIVAPGARNSIVDRFGTGPWHAIHSVFSLGGLAILIYGYSIAPVINLYFPPVGMAHLTLTLMLLATICLVAGVLPAGYIATRTKHPMVLAIKIWALSHLLANGDLASIILFGSLLAWAVIVRISLKRRQRSGEIELRPFVSGRYDLMAVVFGLVVWLAFILKLHELLIGVAPLPALSL